MKCIIKDARTALSRSGLEGTELALNPYNGCVHGCRYCYAPYVVHREPDNWREEVHVKRNLSVLLNKELKKGYEINFATASFGQGIEITPIQLARAFTAIANGGKLIKPYVAEKIVDSKGEVEKIKPVILREQIISNDTVSKLTAMLVSVVENGYASSAKISGYYIAGKTGTAQVPWSALGIDKRGYSEKTWQSFIGFAPALDPRFLILVKLDNPEANTAEYSALPVFRELSKYIIDYWKIPPDH